MRTLPGFAGIRQMDRFDGTENSIFIDGMKGLHGTILLSRPLWSGIVVQCTIGLSQRSRVGRAKALRCPTSFPEACCIGQIGMARPIQRIRPVFREAVKARIGSVRHPRHIAMFDRIVVEIVAMAFKILVITDLVFPITVLPDGLFAFVLKGRRAGGFERSVTMAGEMGFDPHPAGRIIGIVRWQSPEAMQVIGQNHHRVDTERTPLFDGGERLTQ